MDQRPTLLSRSTSVAIAGLLAFLFSCTQQGPGTPGGSAGESTSKTTKSARPRPPEAVRVTVPKGTQIHLTLLSGVSSATSQTGDTFTARTTDPVVVGSRVAVPEGSTVYGQVTDVVPAKKGLKEKGGAITLSFDKVVTPSAISAPMSAGIASVAPKSTKKTAGIIGGSAAGGALLGKVLGGSTKDAAIGAVVGGAIGTGIAAGTKGKEVEIPADSRLTITLNQSMSIAVKP